MNLHTASILIESVFVSDDSRVRTVLPGFNLLEFLRLIKHDFDEIDREYYIEGGGDA